MKSFSSLIDRFTATALLLIGAHAPCLFAQTPPAITQQPVDTFCFTSNRFTLFVTTSGAAPLRYQWYRNAAVVETATNRTLNIRSALSGDAGDWRVVVANDLGAITSSVARVTVLPMLTNGPSVPGLEQWDQAMPRLLRTYGVPGGQLAVTYEGRLVFARSYGYADIVRAQPLQPDTLMRIASNSKAITGMAVMRLVEEGKLALTNLVFPYLGYEAPVYPGSTNDPRLAKITIRHLMQHSGGWDRDTAINPEGKIGFDPTFWPDAAARDLYPGVPDAVTTQGDFVRWVLGKPLQFEPGTRHSYANIGMLTLGRVIEKATGQTYADHVRGLFAQIGATRPRLTRDLPDEGPWTAAGAEEATSIPAPSELRLDVGNNIENRRPDLPLAYRWPRSIRDSSGGWTLSAIDYARFMSGMDTLASTPDLISSNSLRSIQKEATVGPYFGGWYINSSSVPDWYHVGSFFGTLSYCWLRGDNKVAFVAIFNSNPAEAQGDIYSTLDSLSSNVPRSKYPTNDLFVSTLSHAAWKAKHFTAAELGQPELSSDLADPDLDGRPNLAEYAFHRNPRTPDPGPDVELFNPRAGEAAPAGFRFRRLLVGHEVDYRVEHSSDLKTWTALDSPPGPQTLNADGSVQVTVETPAPAQVAEGMRFYRVRAALSPRSDKPL